jgi:hypothetical protein
MIITPFPKIEYKYLNKISIYLFTAYIGNIMILYIILMIIL